MPRSRRGGTGGLSPSTVGLSLAEGRAPKSTLARSRAVMPSMLWETGQKENGEESVFTRSSESDSFGSGKQKKHAAEDVLFGICGAPSLTRTDDLSLTRRLLYQLSY